MGAAFEDCVEVTPARLAQDAAYLLDSTKARTQLGWSPRLSVEDAISETVEWMKRNQHRLASFPAEYQHKP